MSPLLFSSQETPRFIMNLFFFSSVFVFTSTLEAFLVAEFFAPQEDSFTGTKKNNKKKSSSTRTCTEWRHIRIHAHTLANCLFCPAHSHTLVCKPPSTSACIMCHLAQHLNWSCVFRHSRGNSNMNPSNQQGWMCSSKGLPIPHNLCAWRDSNPWPHWVQTSCSMRNRTPGTTFPLKSSGSIKRPYLQREREGKRERERVEYLPWRPFLPRVVRGYWMSTSDHRPRNGPK